MKLEPETYSMEVFSNRYMKCRFCLLVPESEPNNSVSIRTPMALKAIFEEITSRPLDLSEEYSNIVCRICDEDIRKAHEIRSNLIESDKAWKEFLLKEKQETEIDRKPDIRTLPSIQPREVVLPKPIKIENIKNELPDTTGLETAIAATTNDNGITIKQEAINTYESSENATQLSFIEISDSDDDMVDVYIASNTSQQVLFVKKETPESNQLAEPKAKAFACGKCQKIFQTKSLCYEHMMTHRGNDSEQSTSADSMLVQMLKSSSLSADRAQILNDCAKNCVANKISELIRGTPVPPVSPPNQSNSLHWNSSSNSTCVYCEGNSEKYQSVRELQEHVVKAHHNRCMLCQQIFHKLTDLAHHMQDHYEAQLQLENLKCPICTLSFSEKSNLVDHVDRHAKHKCFFCERLFHYRPNLLRHEHSHRIGPPYSCRTCDYISATLDMLQDHNERIHINTIKVNNESIRSTYGKQNANPIWKAEDDDAMKKLKFNGTLAEHPESDKARYFCCTLCDEYCCGAVQFLRHANTMHGLAGQKMYQDLMNIYCDICDKMFIDQNEKVKHMVVHCRYECEVCLKVFGDADAADRHDCGNDVNVTR